MRCSIVLFLDLVAETGIVGFQLRPPKVKLLKFKNILLLFIAKILDFKVSFSPFNSLFNKKSKTIFFSFTFLLNFYFGCGDRNWTCDLRVMSPTRYHFSTPLKKIFSNRNPFEKFIIFYGMATGNRTPVTGMKTRCPNH